MKCIIKPTEDKKMISMYTTIRVHRTTQKQLSAIGQKGDSYENIITKLIKLWVKQAKEEQRK